MVISTVLMILIALVIGLIIWSFANAYIQKNKEEQEGFSFYYSAKIDQAEYETAYGNYYVLVTRTDNEEVDTNKKLSGIRFIFSDGYGASYSYDLDDPPEDSGIIKTYIIKNEDLGLPPSAFQMKTVSIILLYGKGIPVDKNPSEGKRTTIEIDYI